MLRTFTFHLGILLFLCMSLPTLLLAEPDTIYPIHLVGDSIQFAGYNWYVKDSHEKRTGPGTNYFSSNKENVWVDSLGRLHLRIVQRNDNWYCPEIQLMKSLGYGKYTFTLDALPQELDKDVVIGLFTYDHADSIHHHNEVDIEVSKWGNKENMNAQFVMQPFEEKAHRFNTDLTKPTTFSFEIYKSKIRFSASLKSDTSSLAKTQKPVKHTFRLKHPFHPVAEKVCMNVWLFKAIEPASLKPFEVIITNFQFTPYTISPPKNPDKKSSTFQKINDLIKK